MTKKKAFWSVVCGLCFALFVLIFVGFALEGVKTLEGDWLKVLDSKTTVMTVFMVLSFLSGIFSAVVLTEH